MHFLALICDFLVSIYLPIAVAIINTVELVDCVIVGDFAFMKLAVVDFFADDVANYMELSRLGACSSLDEESYGGD